MEETLILNFFQEEIEKNTELESILTAVYEKGDTLKTFSGKLRHFLKLNKKAKLWSTLTVEKVNIIMGWKKEKEPQGERPVPVKKSISSGSFHPMFIHEMYPFESKPSGMVNYSRFE